MTHEELIRRVQEWTAVAHPDHADTVRTCKLVYGAGASGLRGVTYYEAWQNGKPQPEPLVEVCAFGEESPTQLAGTTLHELAHVLAGYGQGHGKAWKDACEALGLRCAKAAGTRYHAAMLDPTLRTLLAQLPPLAPARAGKGINLGVLGLRRTKGPRPCTMGVGTRGGKSRGTGSGSRLRKWVCSCQPKPIIVRVASDSFAAHCDHCGAAFTRG
jgi:hypothetical protein